MVLKDKKNDNSQFLNENIPFSKVLLVISKEEKVLINRQEALNRAKELGLDLFCIAPTKTPPVCKLIDYQKHIFELSKKKKDKKEINGEVGFVVFGVSRWPGRSYIQLNHPCIMSNDWSNILSAMSDVGGILSARLGCL